MNATRRITPTLAVAALAALPAAGFGQKMDYRIQALKQLVISQEAEIAQITQELQAIRGRHATQVAAYQALVLGGQTQQSLINAYVPITTTITQAFAPVKINGNTMLVEGANFQIRHSSNANSSANGLGNLILGFNLTNQNNELRTGSNNIVMGDYHTYTGMNGLVMGEKSANGADYGVILGGLLNEVDGMYTVVGSGSHNSASGTASMVLTGLGNRYSGTYGLVASGWQNSAINSYNVLLGGTQNWTHGSRNVGLTGFNNTFNNYNVASVLASPVKHEWGGNYEFYTAKNW